MTSIFLFGLLAALANVVGGLMLVKAGAHRWGERSLKYLVALGAGFMLAAIFIEILPQTIGLWARTANGEPASAVDVSLVQSEAGSSSSFGTAIGPNGTFTS